MPHVAAWRHPARVMRSYPVVWRENGFQGTGKLEIRPGTVELDGAHGSREIPFAEITAARVGGRSERIEGRPSLILELREGPPVTVSPVSQPGAVTELAERLAALVPPRPG
jgi:hypothetical protein